MQSRTAFPLVAALATVSAAFSQDPAPPQPVSAPAQLPIHNSLYEPTEVWAAGSDYKVRLDGRFEFFPELGPDYPENLPFAWSTDSVTLGGHELLGPRATERRASDHRYEYHSGSVVEAYDLDIEGVEQTFRIARTQHGIASGALVVTGFVDTSLTAAPLAAQHAALHFQDENGQNVVEYGAATVIDALGRRFPMTTTYEEGRIELALDAASVAAAAFPLVVDPVVVNTNPTQVIREMASGALDFLGQIGPRSNFVAMTRIFSASDHDVIATMSNADYGSNVVAYFDIGSAFSTEKIAVASLNAEDRFVLVHERRQAFRTDLVFYSHWALNATLNSGNLRVLNAANGEHFRNPAVGGSLDGSTVLAATYYNPAGSSSWFVRAMRWVATGTSTPTFLTSNTASLSHEVFPSVTPNASPDWLIGWADNSASTNRVFIRGVRQNGIQDGAQIVTESTSNNFSQVKVAGGDNRYVATYRRTPVGIGFSGINATRFDYGATSVTVLATRSLAGGQSYQNRGLAYDYGTRSHWTAIYTSTLQFLVDLNLRRLGFEGATTDTMSVGQLSTFATQYPASIAFARNINGDRFAFAYATGESGNPGYGDNFLYNPVVYTHEEFGTGCSAQPEDEEWSPAIPGSQYFRGTLVGKPGALAACFIGQLTGFYPLDLLGMNGCTLLLEPALAVSIPAQYDSNNDPFLELSFSNDPLFQGAVYTQWVLVQPGTNPLGVVTHAGRAHQVTI